MKEASSRVAVMVAACAGAALVLALLGRLAYTETARRAMYDYDKTVKEALNDPELQAAWAAKLNLIEQRRKQRDDAWGDCNNITDDDRADYARLVEQEKSMPWGLPAKRYGNAESACYGRQAAAQALYRESSEWEIQQLGSYEAWAHKQSGVDKYHSWPKYPKDFRERLAMGEKGLMLGEFWKWASQYIL